MYDSRFQVDQHGTGYIVIVVCLIEEYVLPIMSVGGKFFKNTIWRDSMFKAEALPKLKAN